MIPILGPVKKFDKCIMLCVALSIFLVIYIAFVSYMTFKVHSPLPFACEEEIITATVFLAVFVIIAFVRGLVVTKKNKK